MKTEIRMRPARFRWVRMKTIKPCKTWSLSLSRAKPSNKNNPQPSSSARARAPKERSHINPQVSTGYAQGRCVSRG